MICIRRTLSDGNYQTDTNAVFQQYITFKQELEARAAHGNKVNNYLMSQLKK